MHIEIHLNEKCSRFLNKIKKKSITLIDYFDKHEEFLNELK